MNAPVQTPTMEQMQANLEQQLQQSLARYHDLASALENTKTALAEEDRKVKMIKDTLQGLNVAGQIQSAQAKAAAAAAGAEEA